MPDALNTIMRWLHLSAMATLIGGLLFTRLAMTPAAKMFERKTADALGDRAAAAVRPLAITAIAASVISGVYSLLTVPAHSLRYHVLLGVKLLLALHVFSVVLVIARPGCANRPRLALGAAISGLAIILIALDLTRIS